MLFLILFSSLTGIIKGKVFEEDGKKPLVGVNVVVENTYLGAATNENGEFVIKDVPVGIKTLVFYMIGYEELKLPYVIVKASKVEYLEVKLKSTPVILGGITIVSSYFPPKEIVISGTEFSREEIVRTTGVAEDVSRMVQSMAGVFTESDDRNDIIVRGGSPNENFYLLDNIYVPSLSHFQAMGTSGGTIGIIISPFIGSLKFLSGGFNAEYGNALSSIVNIEYKKGDLEKRNYLFDLSMSGAGLNLDGYFGKIRYLFSARRSFLDLLSKIGAFEFEYGGVPQYYDVQGKITYPLSKNDEINFLFLGGRSWIEITAGDTGNLSVFDRFNEEVVGLNYKKLFSKGLINSSLSYSRPLYVVSSVYTGEKPWEYNNNSFEEHIPFIINFNYITFIDFKTGLDFDYKKWKHWITYKDSTGLDTVVNKKDKSYNAGYYIHISKKFKGLLFNTGLRFSYFDYTGDYNLSPRFSLSYDISSKLNLSFAYGIYYQNPVLVWLTSNEENKNLKDLQCTHYILGLSYLLFSDTKLSLEGYYKNYEDYPIDTEDSTRILINEGASYEGFINFNPMISEGYGYARGIDFNIHKKYSRNFYSNICYSFIDTRFYALDTIILLKSVFTPKHVFKSNIGISLPKDFELGAKFEYSKGKYYYPIDSLRTATEDRLIRDYTTLKEYPPYRRLDLRLSRREYRKNFTIEWYWEVNNVYNRKNISLYGWDFENKKITEYYQWALMIVGGFKIQF